MTTQPPPLSHAPDLILIVSDERMAVLPEPAIAIIRQCESAYHAGTWYVIVPAELSVNWPVKEPSL